MPEADTLLQHTPAVAPVAPASDTPDDELDYDNILLHNIDEKMLRRIFRGLFR
jgi:hypothetical protein